MICLNLLFLQKARDVGVEENREGKDADEHGTTDHTDFASSGKQEDRGYAKTWPLQPEEKSLKELFNKPVGIYERRPRGVSELYLRISEI